MQSFDAVSKGSAQAGHDWPGYWKGKNEAFVAFASVPFGLDAEGYNIWLYEKGGLEMMQELYGKFNLFALPGGQCGQEMGLFSNKRATKMEDFKGMRVRTPGWYMDIMNNLGASVSPLPGGEVYLALERGVIDAAEFSSPAINYPMGFDEITKYAIQPGVHQPGVQCALFFNKDAYEKLPEDLKWIMWTSLPKRPSCGAITGSTASTPRPSAVSRKNGNRQDGQGNTHRVPQDHQDLSRRPQGQIPGREKGAGLPGSLHRRFCRLA
jgi:TRAP-type mannitol/chloroaromatic compound transport system substrate-binding protein